MTGYSYNLEFFQLIAAVRTIDELVAFSIEDGRKRCGSVQRGCGNASGS